MIFKNFLKIVEAAKDNGYRETYLKKINVIFLQKDKGPINSASSIFCLLKNFDKSDVLTL